MEVKIENATIDVDYTIDSGEPMQYHDGNGLGRPGVPASVGITKVSYDGNDVTSLMFALGWKSFIQDYLEDKLL